MGIEASQALETAKEYVQRLNLEGYEITYGQPEIVNRFILPGPNERPEDVDRHDPNKTRPGEYGVPLTINDNNGGVLETKLFVDWQSGKLRGGEGDTCWNPTKEKIIAAVAGKKQRYLLVLVKDEATANTLSQELYQKAEVSAVGEIGRGELENALDNTSIDRDKRHYSLRLQEKPEEKERRLLIEKTTLMETLVGIVS